MDRAVPTRRLEPSIAKERSPTRARVAALSETILSVALQKAENDIYQRNSISRCALLNAPAGSFSKDIDEVESYRVIVTRHALVRFGE